MLNLNKAKQVANFVEEIFDLYHLSKFGFFYDVDEDTFEEYEIPLFSSGEIDDTTLNRLSIKLGLTIDEILSCDDVVKEKYWSKYPFLKLYDLFLDEWYWNARYKKPTTDEALLYAIFNETSEIPAEKRYDYKSVEERMLTQLKELDEFMPGTFHQNATITNLTIETEVLFSFPQITELLCSYIEMVETAKKLFFKALKGQLTQDEINEYNFLVNVLVITDVVMPGTLITYDNVCSYKQAYIEEGFDDFFSYARIRSFVGTGELYKGVDPWRCKEFFDDIELVKKLANIFPEIKSQMRNFEMNVTNFYCDFIWSDAEHISSSPEEEEFDKWTGEYVPLEQRAKEHTRLYVEKNQDELFDWGNYIKAIQKAAGPTIDGGLEIPNRSHIFNRKALFLRMQKRVATNIGGNNND